MSKPKLVPGLLTYGVMLFVFSLVAFLFKVAYESGQERDKFEAKCYLNGGVPLFLRGDKPRCIRASGIIDLDEIE